MDNSREGVVNCKILMILITFCSGDTGFLKCSMTETAFVVDELQQIRIQSCGDHKDISRRNVETCQQIYIIYNESWHKLN